MTLPFMNWDDVTPDDVVETVVMPDQLGSALQDQSEAKYKQQSADRFPGYVDGTLAGGPLASGPLGVVNGMFGKFVSKVAKADPATIDKPKDLQPLVPGFFDLPLTDLFAPLLNALMGVGGGVLGGALGGIADLFAGKWDQVDAIEDGQLALNDQVELLSPLQDYGSAYADGSGAVVNAGNPVAFNHQIGPATGCHLSNGRWYFEDKGLWDIRARVCFSFTIGGGGQGWQIRVYRPDGTLFSYQHDGSSESGSNTREMNTTVVIPEAGYYAQVWITDLIVGRATIGGSVNTRFTVQHISRSTANPI